MMKHIFVRILCLYSIRNCVFLQYFDKTWLRYNCRLAILSIDSNTVNVTGLILGCLENKQSENEGVKWNVSSCKVKGHMKKQNCIRIIQWKKSRSYAQY